MVKKNVERMTCDVQTVFSLILGYFVGCLNPAKMAGKRYDVNLREEGTGNLGATNAACVLGKRIGIAVLAIDVAKSFLSYKLARLLFPQLMIAGLLAGIGVILGHCYPVFHSFQGGKGLAAYAGMVLAHNITFFFLILISGSLLMLLLNTGVAATLLGTALFPVLIYLQSHSLPQTLTAATASLLIFYTHRDNIRHAFLRTDTVRPREFFGISKK